MITKGIFQETLAKIVLILSGFVLNVGLGRYLGVEEYGVVGIVTGILFVFELFLTNGIRQSVSKVLSSQDINEKSLWWNSLIIQLGFCIGLIIIGLISLDWIVSLLTIEQYRDYLFLIFLIIPVEGIYYINLGFLNGRLLYKQHAISNSIYSFSRMFFSLTFLFIFNNGVLAVLLGTLSAYIISLFTTRTKREESSTTNNISIKDLLNITFGALSFYIFVNIFMNIDILILRGLGLSTKMIGYYKANASVGSMLYFLFASVLQVSYPLISKLFAQKSYVELKSVINTLFIAILYSSSLAFLFFTFFADKILLILFGPEFINFSLVMPLYALSMGLLSILIMLGNMMIVFEQKKTYLLFLFGSFLIYLLLMYFGTSFFQLYTPPIALIIISIISITFFILLLKKNELNLFETRKIFLIIFWLSSLIFISIILNNQFNSFLVGLIIFIIFTFISFISINEIRTAIINSIKILIRGAK